jgi:hypothetical protein
VLRTAAPKTSMRNQKLDASAIAASDRTATLWRAKPLSLTRN